MGEIFGLFGVQNYDEARRMTLREYRFRWRGYLLAFLDKEYFVHLEAFASQQITATNKKGEPLYGTFADFYDKEKRKKEIFGDKEMTLKSEKLAQIARNLREYRKQKGERRR